MKPIPSNTDQAVARSLELAESLGRNGQLVAKEKLLRELLSDFPGSAEAWNRLGITAAERNNALQALVCLERAIALAPGEATFHANLGELWRRAGLPDKALPYCERAVQLDASNHGARLNLGWALLDTGLAEQARDQFGHATRLDGGKPQGWFGLGRSLLALGQCEGAADAFSRCAALIPGDHQTRVMLASVRIRMGDFDQGLEEAKRAFSLAPNLLASKLILADALTRRGAFAEAEGVLRAALAEFPNEPSLLYRLAICRLAQEDYLEGFRLYEARQNLATSNPVRNYALPMPQWRGEKLEGKRLLVVTEQGYGDHLQFCRFVPRLAERGVRVEMAVPPTLLDLMRTLPGCAKVTSDMRESLDSACDYWTYVGSLPWHLGLAALSADDGRPYLGANPAKRAAWRERLAPHAGKLKVGLVWAGRAEHENDRQRSLPLAELSPLAGLDKVVPISLQLGPAAEAAGNGFVRFPGELQSFEDTAALMAELDLFISVDTAPAHLCGALGRPVWLVLPQVADWRWGQAGSGTPWYPSMRIFRQGAGGWSEVIGRIAGELARFGSR